MKRISISAIALLVAAAGAAEARPVYGYGYGYGASRYRVRWSPYTHGLISGDVYYSPYARASGGSGLVDAYVRYSPYAFGGGHSGLVIDEGGSYFCGFGLSYYPVHRYPVLDVCNDYARDDCGSHPHVNQSRTHKKYSQTIEERKARRAELAEARLERNAARANDGKLIIAAYLKSKDIDFTTTRILSIEGRTVSVDFLLNDGKTILKYWNPAEIPSQTQAEDRYRKFYEKYVESWKITCAEHLIAGGGVHQIVSPDRDEILAKLTDWSGLNEAEKVYASAQD